MAQGTGASRAGDAQKGVSGGGALLSVNDIELDGLTRDRDFFPSPDAWEDHALYFLLVDRFSDGHEKGYRDNEGTAAQDGETPPFDRERDFNSAVKDEAGAARWREAGETFVGGNLRGLGSKLGYIKRLGAGAVWVSPVFKQAPWAPHDYHGYGIQNFLEIDPHYGTREDLRDLVRQAHDMGLYVVLDVVVNHCCDAFAYEGDESPNWDGGREYPVKGFRAKDGTPNLPFGPLPDDYYPDAGVWPRELQNPAAFTRQGQMRDWENCPEYVDGDFFALKDLHLGDGEGDDFRPSSALEALIRCYQFWIAYADVDGFRIDTTKHMGVSAARHFADRIHEFAKKIGKRNFYLIAEIGGGNENSYEVVWRAGLDAALAIDEIPGIARDVIAGRRRPTDYFEFFRNHLKDGEWGEATWLRQKLVTFLDDHDQVWRPVKGRFASEFEDRAAAERALVRAFGFNLCSMGIPCIYYGTEQALDGHALDPSAGNRYIRESMFGGEFGPFRSRGRHVFNEESYTYREFSRILHVRQELPALRRGRQFLRPVSGSDGEFRLPADGDGHGVYHGVVAWSRILDVDEVICAINTDETGPCSMWVEVDAERHAPGTRPLRCIYSTDPAQEGTECGPPEDHDGRTAVCLTVPAGGFVIFQ